MNNSEINIPLVNDDKNENNKLLKLQSEREE